MSPYQHGEVFVTRDGSETDMDLGHYERFIDLELTRSSNVTAGQVYSGVIANERLGEYLGGTIQTVPHVTNVIKREMQKLAEESDPDVVVVEVGGTVGDIEGLPFLEAIRQMRNDIGRRRRLLHPPHLPAIHQLHGRAEDQADAAQRQGAPRHRHPARLPSYAAATTQSARRSRRKITRPLRRQATRASSPLPDCGQTIYEVPLILRGGEPGRSSSSDALGARTPSPPGHGTEWEDHGGGASSEAQGHP